VRLSPLLPMYRGRTEGDSLLRVARFTKSLCHRSTLRYFFSPARLVRAYLFCLRSLQVFFGVPGLYEVFWGARSVRGLVPGLYEVGRQFASVFWAGIMNEKQNSQWPCMRMTDPTCRSPRSEFPRHTLGSCAHAARVSRRADTSFIHTTHGTRTAPPRGVNAALARRWRTGCAWHPRRPRLCGGPRSRPLQGTPARLPGPVSARARTEPAPKAPGGVTRSARRGGRAGRGGAGERVASIGPVFSWGIPATRSGGERQAAVVRWGGSPTGSQIERV
jgi:hypothetical protein